MYSEMVEAIRPFFFNVVTSLSVCKINLKLK